MTEDQTDTVSSAHSPRFVFSFLKVFCFLFVLCFPWHGNRRSSSRPSLRSLGVGVRWDLRERCESAGRSSVKFAGHYEVSPPAAAHSSLPVDRQSSLPAVHQSSLPAVAIPSPLVDRQSSLPAVAIPSPPAVHRSSSQAAARSDPPAGAPSSPPATLKSSLPAAPTSSPPAAALQLKWIQFPCSGQECRSMSPGDMVFKSCCVHRNILITLSCRSCLVCGVPEKRVASLVMAAEAIPKPPASPVAPIEAVPESTPERAPDSTSSPRRAVVPSSCPKRSSASKLSPGRCSCSCEKSYS